MIEFESVAKVYDGQREALSNVNFRLAPGEMAFLTGHSGAGKSTLLRLILGFETASSGVVRVVGLIYQHYRVKSWRVIDDVLVWSFRIPIWKTICLFTIMLRYRFVFLDLANQRYQNE